MSYWRVYPNKNNTIFYTNYGTTDMRNGLVNTGKNQVMELRDGASYSILLFGFDTEEIKNKLSGKTYTCNFKLFDDGVVREPSLRYLKPIELRFFETEFVEGDGYSFVTNETINGVSNYISRTTNDLWQDEFITTPLQTFQLNTSTDDIKFDNLQDTVQYAIDYDTNCNFAIKLDSYTTDTNLYAKFIKSKYTKTIFRPYLEFFIEEESYDERLTLIEGVEGRVYIKNFNKISISNLSVEITDSNDENAISPTLTQVNDWLYYYSITIPIGSKFMFEKIYINSTLIRKQTLNAKQNLDLFNINDNSDVYFYPTVDFTSNLVNKGDVFKLNLIAKKQNKNNYVSKDFEYRITTTSGFEMCPWIKFNIHESNIYSFVDTSFFFEEVEYVVNVRLNEDVVKTSPLNYKFRIVYNDNSRLSNITTSPYNNRNIYINK